MNIRETNTTMFLVPGLGFDVEAIRDIYGFVNGYLKDKDCAGEYDDAVFMLFRPADLAKFSAFVTGEYDRERRLLEDYDYEGGFVVLVYQFPEEYMPEYRLFLKGKYSKFRKRYISKLPKVDFAPDSRGQLQPALNIAYMACTRSEKLRQFWQERFADDEEPFFILDETDEYWLKPRLEKETLDIDRIRERLSKR